MLIENQVWIDGQLHSIKEITHFYIDESGNKHVDQDDSSWQELECQYEDALVYSELNWRLKNEHDAFLEQQKKAVESIEELAFSIRRETIGVADYYETAGWAEKARRAERVVSDNESAEDLAILQAEVTLRDKNETPKQLAQRQLEKASSFAMSTSVIDGWVSRSTRLIMALETESEIAPLVAELKQSIQAELAALTEEIE
ncbi:hypothetical protein [Marinomonas transparens]|uniref:Uncharacterized protein n=1 Tax=Marinomonas transparens TaxID=2795388 RepID=A0A934JP44_9GAMM|nr:hypothetical protein [Marinomonas transparens]MBJ7537153.1 hypothetical protein [Marinomonas transparens]